MRSFQNSAPATDSSVPSEVKDFSNTPCRTNIPKHVVGNHTGLRTDADDIVSQLVGKSQSHAQGGSYGRVDFVGLICVLRVHHLESARLVYSKSLPAVRSTRLDLLSSIKELDDRESFGLRINERRWLAIEYSFYRVHSIIPSRS